jgi:acetyl esterase
LVLSLICAPSVAAQQAEEVSITIAGASMEVYKSVGDVSLRLWILPPAGHTATDSSAAMVFFFGGGWVSGSAKHLEPQARALSSLGMVSVLADYRVLSRHGTKAEVAVEDAKSAIRWLRLNAKRLGIDPTRIGAAGGSAGGHLAAATATLPGFEAAGEDQSVSSSPNALVLFNPALVLAPLAGVFEPPESLHARIGVDFEELSPYHHLRTELPPTLIMHGTADQIVPFETVKSYCERAVSLANDCVLVPYADANHAFFNKPPYYQPTLARMLAFLRELGWLPDS